MFTSTSLRAPLLAVLLSSPAAAFDGTAAAGLRDWGLYCAACHGADGRGKRGLESLQGVPAGTLDLTGRGLEGWPDEALEASIARMAEKRPGLKDSHALSTASVAGLISYLRIVARGDAVVLSTAAWAEIRDPGERAYLKACAPCHGRTGAAIFHTGWSSTPDPGLVDLRPPLPKRKPRPKGRDKREWISFEGTLSPEEQRGLTLYLEELETKERNRKR